jgi:hypothetical protein
MAPGSTEQVGPPQHVVVFGEVDLFAQQAHGCAQGLLLEAVGFPHETPLGRLGPVERAPGHVNGGLAAAASLDIERANQSGARLLGAGDQLRQATPLHDEVVVGERHVFRGDLRQRRLARDRRRDPIVVTDQPKAARGGVRRKHLRRLGRRGNVQIDQVERRFVVGQHAEQ